MVTPDTWRTVREAFARLQRGEGTNLRAEYHPGGWGSRIGLSELTEAAPAAPLDYWYLADAPKAEEGFKRWARQGAKLTGHDSAGVDGWLPWLDLLRGEGLGCAGYLCNDVQAVSIPEVCAASEDYCAMLETGHVPLPIGTGNEAAAPASSEPCPNRARVDAYIREVLDRTGEKVIRAMLYRKAGHDRQEFQRWQRNDPLRKPTRAAARAFERILAEKPHLTMKPKP